MAERNGSKAKPARRPKQDRPGGPLAVVGIGVCAASLPSLVHLLAELPEDLGAAFVVAVRQQDGLTVRRVIEALADRTAFAVKIAEDGERLAPNLVYVGGPDDLVTFADGHISTRPATEPVGHRGTIDSMLVSLSEHARENCVAVILGGLGSDGTTGVTATKKFGGLSIAEAANGDAEATEHGAATAGGFVDLLLPIEDIPYQVVLYVHGLAAVGRPEEGEKEGISEDISARLLEIASILRTITGNDFHGYKRNTFLRRVQRRMQVTQVPTIDAYLAKLKRDPDEAHHLFQDLLIGVTQFFRDPQEFEALEKKLPHLFQDKGREDQFRAWVLGCATGEEAYSIAILLSEYLAGAERPPQVQIFATDLDSRALGAARAGRYAATIADQVSPGRLARWFTREGDTYCVSKELREMCIFSPHNLVKDAPFSRIDLLSCRNLLIYLDADLQNRVIPIFHFSLRPGGILFLGSSENISRHQKLFAPIDRKNRLFRRLETATRILPEFPLTPRIPGRGAGERPPVQARPGALAASIGRRASQVSERYAPAYVVIDSQHEVLHFSGRTGRFLEPASGAASLNLLNLVHRDLRLDLRTALHRVAEERHKVELPRVPLAANGTTTLLNIVVEPIGKDGELTAMVVVFQDLGAPPPASEARPRRGATDEHVERLEADLRLAKDRLQATIEELESTNEELKSSNEEYQSINEELQSANEELETSKEELQSVNEELQTVNAELDHRVRDLARANSDLRNLLESTQIATVFLDNELRVRSFTPTATDVFHLVETDIGRPIDHLGSRLVYPQLAADVRQVLTKLGMVERALSTIDGGAHYTARVHPYRSTDNFIAGAVLTFLDVTGTVRAESALHESEARLRTMFAELQHRVRNTLAVVKSITRRTAETSTSVEDMVAHLTGRLDAFARVQALVSRNPDAGIDLAGLVSDELLAHATQEGARLAIGGPEVLLRARPAESLSLAVHELATNAIKHGALSGRRGHIAVSWALATRDGTDRLEFAWKESGVEGVVREPKREGFGMELLLRSLPYDLDAETKAEFGPDGISFTMSIPSAALLAEARKG